MAVRQYVGARYVPKIYQNPNGTNEWKSGVGYEALTVVYYYNTSYTSAIPVPPSVGNPKDNPKYWVRSADYNVQVETYRQETEDYHTEVNNLKTSVDEKETALNNKITTNANNIQNNSNLINQLELPNSNFHRRLYIGHRGCSFAPENTREAFRCGLEWGYDGVEGDLNYTSDGELFMMHDSEISHYTNDAEGNPRNMTWKELNQYNYNKGFEDSYTRGTLTNLENYISIAKLYNKWCEIDIASRGVDHKLPQAVSIVKNSYYSQRVIFACDRNNYKTILDLLPEANITVGCYSVDDAKKLNAEIKKRTNNYLISVNFNPNTYKDYMFLGIPIKYWTTNDTDAIGIAISGGASEFITDSGLVLDRGVPISFTPVKGRIKADNSSYITVSRMTGGLSISGFLEDVNIPQGISTILFTHFPVSSTYFDSTFHGYAYSLTNNKLYPLRYFPPNHININCINEPITGQLQISMVYHNNTWYNSLQNIPTDI